MKILNLFLVLFLAVFAVQAQTFTNPATITIVDAAPANPSPSTINVAGVAGTVTGVSVTINGYSHTFSDDVGILLVGPTGRAFLLQDGAGDDPDMNNVTYTFSDAGTAFLPDLTAWGPGTYKPTSYFAGDTFTGFTGPIIEPGPNGTAPQGTFASVFNGTNPNGAWRLFVEDFVGGDSGVISGGWTLTLAGGATASGVTVSGRVLAPKGINARSQVGLANAKVQITDQAGQSRTMLTDMTGNFVFEEVAAGQTYVFSVSSRKYQYDPQVITVSEDLTNLNFTPRR